MVGLSQDKIKIIAIAAMLIDHIAVCFLNYDTLLYFLSRLVGKMTIPIMCYFIADGYYNTRSLEKYAIRLFGAALISHIPFYYFQTGTVPSNLYELTESFKHTSVMWTLFLGLMALSVYKSSMWALFKVPLLMLFLCLAVYGDWRYYAVIWILIFGIYKDNTYKQFVYFAIAAIAYSLILPINAIIAEKNYSLTLFYQSGLLLAIPVLLTYNGHRSKSPAIKWFFYLFYPVHLVVLAVIRQYVA